MAIHKAAGEALGKRKKNCRKKGLRIWNEEIKNAIKDKQKAYDNYLAQNTPEGREI